MQLQGSGEVLDSQNNARFCPVNQIAAQPLGALAASKLVNLGPESILWQYAGDYRAGLPALSHGILPLMHPAIGAGVGDHSNFYKDPCDRILRSIPEIIGTIYDQDGEKTGHKVRDYHKNIQGTDQSGRCYNALDPETFWFAHATFHHNIEDTIGRFTQYKLTDTTKEQLYTETTEWYRRYGMSMDPVPANHADFTEKWNQICDEVLEVTPAAERAINMALARKIERLPSIPPVIWKLGKLPTAEIIRLTTIGGIPKPVRDKFDIPWSKTDERQLKIMETSIKEGWRFIYPKQLRYFPRARAAYKRSKVEMPAI